MSKKIYTKDHPFNADIYTPVELYLSLRHAYRKACLMESNDYHSRQDSKSFIGFEPIVELKLEGLRLTRIINGEHSSIDLDGSLPISEQVQAELNAFEFSKEFGAQSGYFGRVGFEFSLLNETHINNNASDLDLPDLHLFVYKYILIIDHFKDTGVLLSLIHI